ncbi:MAG: response regulator [Acidimicrobiales bacterium]|nr:response regulator [Hyphomonadaceae bacterium]RZV41697.1 MAG: response regulator [Acidimicrobiales bacterium]
MTLDSVTPNFKDSLESSQVCDLLKGVCHTSIPSTRLADGDGSEILEIIDSHLNVGISILDKNNRYKFINKLVYDQLQIAPDDLVVGDSFEKSMKLVNDGFGTPLEQLEIYNPKHALSSHNNPEQSEHTLPLIQYPNGSIQKVVVKKLPDGQKICLNYDVSKLFHKNRMLQKAMYLGNAGYCNYDFKTKKYDVSDSILESVPKSIREKILKKGLWAIVHTHSKVKLKKAFQDLPKNNGNLDITIKTLNRKWIKAIGTAEKENGKWSVFRIFLEDVTEARKQAQEMEIAKNQAVAATIAKSQFLANMSHEIRTPMNGVMGMAELLARRDLGLEELKMVEIISRSAQSLLEIINDILDFSKIEADALELESSRVDIEMMLTDIVALLNTVAAEKNIDLKLVIPIDTPQYFIGDYLRLRQVVLNLVGNALKFTEKGSVTVSANWNQGDNKNSELTLSIVDTGIGMKEETVSNIFEQFSQADNSTTRQYGGTGLGLSITKRIVELMGGTINVNSVFNKGSEFKVVLPLQPANRDNQIIEKTQSVDVPRRPENDRWSFPNPSRFNEMGKVDILVAEDQELNRNVMSLMLAETRFAPVFAKNGSEAVRMFNAHPKRYAAILMDISMPVMDGIEATDKIVSFETARKLPHTPIIAVTGHSHQYTRELCLEANMDDYMLKPVKRSILVPKLEHWIQAGIEDGLERRSQLLNAG